MFFKETLFVTLIISFFAGCGSTPVPPAKKEKVIPAWVSAPVPDDGSSIYGVAMEEDRESAIRSALNDMVGKLGVSLESNYQSDQEVSGYYNKSTVKSSIKADIAKIKINNYEVVKSQRISYREFAVMIKTDKQKFFRGIVEDLDFKKQSIQNRYNATADQDSLTKYNVKKTLANEAKGLVSSILIAYELDRTFNKSAYLNFVQNMEKNYESEKKKLNFYIYGDKRSQNFVSKMKNYLATQGFNVSSAKKGNSVVIKVNTSDNISRSQIQIAVLNLKVEVYNNSKRVGGKTLILKERYNGSIASVYKNAAIHLEQDINSRGINEVIGISLDTSK